MDKFIYMLLTQDMLQNLDGPPIRAIFPVSSMDVLMKWWIGLGRIVYFLFAICESSVRV